MELIDKAAVVARLEEKLKSLQKEYNELVREEYWGDARNVAPRIDEIKNIISLISNFRGKEADLVKESEDYKQKYEEALSRARVVNPGTKDYNIVTAIFPELKESEDERIRKAIIEALKQLDREKCPVDTYPYLDWAAWLEKQGKQEQLYIRFGEIPIDEISKIYRGEIEVGTENGVSVYPAFKTDEGDIVLGLSLPITKTTLYTQQQLIEYGDRPCYLVKGNYVGKDTDGQPLINNVSVIEKIDNYKVKEEKQGEQKPADKIEPKFKIEKDKWYICIRELYDAYNNRIFTKGNIYHSTKDETLMSDNSNVPYEIKYCPDHYFCLWTILDSKVGDIIEFEDHGRLVIGIISFINRASEKVDTYCLLEEDKFKVGVFYTLDTINPHPVTAEQHKFFFKKMKEAGYEWDGEKKELIRHGQ